MSIQTIEYFFINTWLWSMTWGLYHVPINILVTLALLKFVGRFKIVMSVLLSFFSQVFALAVYALIVFFLVFICKLGYMPKENLISGHNINVLLACISLGIVYSALQALFFWIVNRFYQLKLRIIILLSFVGNIITALFVYRFLDVY